MKMRFLPILMFLCFLGISTSSFAQLTGIKTIPGNYATITLAVADVNTQGVGAGGVTFNVAAGYTETIAATISLTATGTVANPIIFQKSGAGVNPKITAYTGGGGTPATPVQDGIFNMVGSDYVTIDGIDLSENAANTANPTTMEYGYAMYKASATDGCQNNTIRNCVITLDRINNATGSGPAVDGSRGIDVVNALASAAVTNVTVTAATGTNSNNRFYSNTIQNCNIGIAIIGFVAATPFTNGDTGNDIGGVAPATGNIIRNFGGGAAAVNPAAAVRTLAQYGINVSYNTVNSNDGSGVNHISTLRGIYLNTATSASATVTFNTITVKGGGTSSILTAIENASGSTSASNTVTISNNTIQNCIYTTATTATFTGILTSATATTVNMNGNTISNNNLGANGTASSATFQGIYSSSSPVNLNINTNTITNNQVLNQGGTMYCTRAGTSIISFNGNIVNNNSFPNAGGSLTSTIYGYYNLTSATVENLTNNSVDNLTISGSTTSTSCLIYGIYSFTVAADALNISGNRVHTLTFNNSSTGAATIIGLRNSSGNAIYSKNKVYNLSAVGASSAVFGINCTGGTSANISNNYIGDLRTPSVNAAISLIGINITGSTTVNVYYNTVYLNATSSGALFGSSAINASTTPTVTLQNNNFVNLSTPNGATGFTTAYRRTTTTLTTYGANSNRNNFYAGTPSANFLIFYDGTNSDQTLAAFQARVTPRDVNSVSTLPNFVSTTGSSPMFLHINTTLATLLESGAANIAGITDDYDGDIRQGNGGYGGTGTAPDIGADEFNGIAPIACTGAPAAATAIASPSSACSGSGAVLSLTPVNTDLNITYQWQSSVAFAGPYAPIPGATGSTYSTGNLAAGTYYYNAVITCSTSMMSTVSGAVTLVVNPSPVAAITPANPTICSGSSVQLTASGGTTYAWSPPTGLNQVTGSVVVASPTANTTYTVTVTNAFGCTSTASTTVSVNIIPAVTASATPTSICVGGTSNLSSVVTNANYSVVPITLDTIAVPGSGVTALASNGVANVALTAGSLDDGYWAVTLPFPLKLYGISYTTANIGTNGNMHFGVGTTGGYNPLSFPSVSTPNAFVGGVFGDLDLGAVPAPGSLVRYFTTGVTPNRKFVVSYTEAGFYNSGSLATSFTSFQIIMSETDESIEVHTAKMNNSTTNKIQGVENAAGTVGVAVAGRNNTLVWTGVPDAYRFSQVYTYAWSPAGLLNNPAIANPVASNIVTTTTFIVTVTDLNGCTGTASATVTANPNASLAVTENSGLTANDGIICSGGTVTLAITGGTGYMWSTGATTSSIVVNPVSTTVYSVTVSDATTCTAVFVTTVTVSNVSAAIVISETSGTTNNDGQVCAGATATLTASGGGTYAWSTGATTAAIMVTPAGTTNYSVTVTNAQGCTATSSATITVNPVPVASISGTTTICAGTSTTLTASGGGTYAWSTGATTAAISVSPITNTVYTVTVTSVAGCTATSSVSVTVNPGVTLSSALTQPTTCVSLDGAINLTVNTGTGPFTYNWSTPNGIGLINGQEDQTNLSVGSYFVTVTSSNSCTGTAQINLFGPGGCSLCPLIGLARANPDSICPGGTTTLRASQLVNMGVTYGIRFVEFPAPTLTPYIGGTIIATVPNGSLTMSGTEALAAASFVTPGTHYLYAILNPTPTDPACTPSYGFTVTVNTTPNASISGNTTICNGGSTTLTGIGGGTYAWSTGATTQQITVSPTMTTVYTVTVTSAQGCTATATVSVTVNTLPTAQITGVTTICAGQSTTLTASGGGTYAWSTGATTAAITVSPVSNTVYTVTVTNANSCTATASATVTINPAATASISGTTTICAGQSTTLTASGGGTYAWSTGATTAAITVSPIANTTYTVTVTNASSCTATASATVVVNALPVVTITGNAPICVGQSRTLTATGGGTYAWSTGATTAAITVSPISNTTYTVTVTNANSCTATSSATVVVNALPIAAITGATSICSGTSTTLTASGGISYAWSTGATTAAITVSPIVTTTYTVTVTNANSCTSTASRTVTVIQTPTPVITANGPLTFCYGGSVTLSTPAVAGWTVQWTVGNNVIPGATGQSYVVTQTGIYRVRVTNNGCTGVSAPVSVVAVAPPVAIILGPTQVNICQGNVHTFQAQTGPSYTFQWYRNNVVIAGATMSSFTTGVAGKYTVEVSNGLCSTLSLAKVLNVEPFPTVTVYPQGTVQICNGDVAYLTSNVSGGAAYQWFLNGVIIPGATSQNYNTVNAGTYQLRVTSTLGCISWSNMIIVETIIVDVPTVTVSQYAICDGDSAILSVPNNPAHYYQWYKDNVWIPGANGHTLIVKAAGTYYLEIQTEQGCTDYTEAIVITVGPAPNLTLTATPVSSKCKTVTYNIQASANGAGIYQWFFDGQQIPNPAGNLITNAPGGLYLVIFTNGCGQDMDSILVTPDQDPRLKVYSESKPVICPGETITLIANPGNGTNYQWFKDFVAIPGANGTTLTVGEAGFYWVTATIDGCDAKSGIFKVFVNALPLIEIKAVGPTDVPMGGSVTMFTYKIGGVSYQWLKDGIDIPGATDTLYEATTSGDYSVLAYRNRCTAESNVITVNVGGTIKGLEVRGQSSTNSLMTNLYPVPAHTEVMIHSNQVGMHKIEVMSLDGRMMSTTEIDMQKADQTLDLRQLPVGMYIIRVHYDGQVSQQLLPVQH